MPSFQNNDSHRLAYYDLLEYSPSQFLLRLIQSKGDNIPRFGFYSKILKTKSLEIIKVRLKSFEAFRIVPIFSCYFLLQFHGQLDILKLANFAIRQ
ncbi:hypothetical protein D3C75_819190 [compost metagenome]